jgi:flagellar protein FlbD
VISLTRLNGNTIAINPDLIVWIDVTPDTTVSLLGGDKVIVRESLDDVIERVVTFRRLTGVIARSPSADVLNLIDPQQGRRRVSHRPEPPSSRTFSTVAPSSEKK